MFYLHRLLDESLQPLDPDIPLIFGSGVLTGIVPSAARGNATSWSPESGVLMDSNAGDYFPSFIRMNGIDHLVLYGRAAGWTLLHVQQRRDRVSRRDAVCRARQHRPARARSQRLRRHVDARPGDGQHHARRREPRAERARSWAARRRATRAAARARRWDRCKLKAIVVQGQTRDFETAQPYKGYNRDDRAEAARHLGRQARAEDARHAVSLQAEPAARRDGDEEQPGDDVDRQARRREHRSVPPRHGGLLPLPGELPAAERDESGRRRSLRPRRRPGVRDARQVRPEHRHRSRSSR